MHSELGRRGSFCYDILVVYRRRSWAGTARWVWWFSCFHLRFLSIMVSCLYASTDPLIKYQDEYVHSLQHTPSCASNCPRTQRNPITCPKKTCISNLENGSGVDVSEDTGEDTVNFICYLQTISCPYSISDVVFENGYPRGSRHVPRFNAGCPPMIR